MSNIVDYLTWRGDLSLTERAFNDVDNLILATLSYIDFSGVVSASDEESVSLADACRRILELTDGDVAKRVRSVAKVNARFLEQLAASGRFAQMRLHHYVDEFDEDASLQFAALQIDLDDQATYVSFRGTDSTLVGWREDFMLSFTVTEAQREAQRYLSRVLSEAQERGQHVYVGGHSKGGNLAVYAVLNCPEELRSLVSCVWSNDGPGFAPETLQLSPFSQLKRRYRRIVPAYDLVGIIFERDDDPRTVVRSSGFGAYQHDPLTWQVTARGMSTAKDLTTESKLMKDALKSWLVNVPLEQRSAAVDQMFDALGAGGADSLSDVADPQSLGKVIDAMGSIDDATKEVLTAFLGALFSKTVDAASSAVQDAANAMLKDVADGALSAAKLAVDELKRRVEASTSDAAKKQKSQTEPKAEGAKK